ncbi:cysteine desulfurase family protein [Thermicanus aegyptius]|uniref:cysteine desulfurase family protein n=1 Tax=Thermicanus aegyptius TaxID=94009 RepID=UPI00040410CF|nr:cysteine desulfurase family protein [Thermicanus aegyptius]
MEIYLDNSATTRPYPEVIETYARAMEEFYANSESLHPLGIRAGKMLEKARETASSLLSVLPEEIVFTSGGTESNNLAIYGSAHANRERGRHVVTTSIEHPSVLRVFKQLEKEGFQVTYLPVSEKGEVSLEDVKRSLTDGTILLSMMYVNNEVGSIQPVAKIGELLKPYPKVLFHVDAVQAFGKLPLDIKGWGIDLLSLSGHKFHGPKGTGLLYKNKKVRLSPVLLGGGQEMGLRPGTVNVPGIIALVKAMRLSLEKKAGFVQKAEEWKKRLCEALLTIPGLMINSPANGAPHILNFSLPPLKGETLLHALEEEGMYVSTRSACSSRQEEMSHVLKAMGLTKERGLASIRLSLSLMNRDEEIEKAIEILKRKLPFMVKMLGGKR